MLIYGLTIDCAIEARVNGGCAAAKQECVKRSPQRQEADLCNGWADLVEDCGQQAKDDAGGLHVELESPGQLAQKAVKEEERRVVAETRPVIKAGVSVVVIMLLASVRLETAW